MGYMKAWNANNIVDLEPEETLTPEQIDELQLTEAEQAELDAE